MDKLTIISRLCTITNCAFVISTDTKSGFHGSISRGVRHDKKLKDVSSISIWCPTRKLMTTKLGWLQSKPLGLELKMGNVL